MIDQHDPRLLAYLATVGVDAQDAEAALAGWKVSIAQRDGEDVAIVVVKGPEIHFVSLSEKKAMTRKNTLDYLAPLIERYGYATTRVPLEVEDHRLRTMLGFQFSWSDTQYTYWALTSLPFQRKSS